MTGKFVLFISILMPVVASAASSHVINNDDDASDAAASAIVQYKLAPQPLTCLYFDTDDEGADYLVRVREKHDARCGGDLDTSPAVLFLKIRKSDGHIKKMSIMDGNYQELSPVQAGK